MSGRFLDEVIGLLIRYEGALVESGDIARGKFDLDVVGHYARPDIFHLRVNEQPLSAVSVSAGEPHV